MVHIKFNTDEKKFLRDLKFPDGTTLVQCKKNKYGSPMYRFRIVQGKWVKEYDFVERDRPWKRGEREAFEAAITPESMLEYFIGRNYLDEGPYREYTSMSDAMRKTWKFIFAEAFYVDRDKNIALPSLKICLYKDSDIDAAEKEIGPILTKWAERFPEWRPMYIDILERTLSARGIYFLYWDGEDEFRLMKTTYGHEEQLEKFTSLRETLKFVAKNHYYEKVTPGQ